MRSTSRPHRSSDPSLTVLVRRARNGDEVAFTALVARYQDLVLAVARRCNVRDYDVDDVMQQTWLALYRHLGSIEDPERLAGWLRTSAARIAWRVVHDRRAGFGTPSDDLVADGDRRSPIWSDVEEQAVIEDERRQVRRAYVELSARDQAVLSLTVTAAAPQPYQSVARQLGCPVGSIGPFRQRALRRLERRMSGLRPLAGAVL